MKMQVTFLCFLTFAGVISANASKMEVTPVQKVLALMSGMLEKGKKEKHEEQVVYAESSQFCEDTQASKKRTIKAGSQDIAGLKAQIAKHAADVARLTKEIAAIEKDVSTWTGDQSAASKVRATQKGDYGTTHKDYTESIDAIGRAIKTLKATSKDRSQASFLQVSSLSTLSLIPDAARKTIDSFLEQDEEAEGLEMGAPQANAYEFQSQGVVDMLDKLLSKFIDERTGLEKKEANSKNAFNLFMQDMKAQVKQGNQDVNEKKTSKAKRLASKADASGDQNQAERALASDSKYLSELTANCATKKSDFESRQQLRADEITAIEKAVEIISGGAVKGAASKHLPSLVQNEFTSFGQLRSSSNMEVQVHLRVSQFLSAQAEKLNSRLLSAVAVRASADPMAKVKKMIEAMVTKLLTEANEEAEHKGYCDTELTTNAQTRKEKTDAVSTLNAEIESLGAAIAKLNQSISSLTKQVSDLDAESAQATKIRIEEKQKNKATIQDAKAAQTAVAQALTVLKEFYAKAGEATAFVQAPYQGMGGESGGVVGMLEVIESDFARLESETATSEATSEKKHDDFTTETKVNKADKQADIEHKTAKKQDKEQSLTIQKADLEGNQNELDAALSYYDKLKPSCVDSGVSYEDRVARRKDEIESLQNALKLLS